MSSEKHRKLKLAVFSIRMQVIMMFILLTVLLVGIITQIYTGYYRRIMENEVIRQTINTGEQISTKTEMFLDEANKILQWGNSTDAYDFLNAEGTRREETLQLINDIKMYRTSMLIDKTVQNVYLFDIDGTTYNEKIGIYQREKYRKSIYIYEKIMQQQDCLIFVSKNEAEEDMILYGTRLCQPLRSVEDPLRRPLYALPGRPGALVQRADDPEAPPLRRGGTAGSRAGPAPGAPTDGPLGLVCISE